MSFGTESAVRKCDKTMLEDERKGVLIIMTHFLSNSLGYFHLQNSIALRVGW